MATVHVTCWQHIPVLVTARDEGGEATVPLSAGFQDLVDRVAMQVGASDPDAYLAGWRVEEAGARPGPAAEVAGVVARELEGRLEALRARHTGGALGDAGRPTAAPSSG